MRMIFTALLLTLAGVMTAHATEPSSAAGRDNATAAASPVAGLTAASADLQAVEGGSYLLADKDNFEDKVKDSLGLTKSKPVHSRKHHRWHRRRHHATPKGKAKSHSDHGKSKVVHHDTPKGKPKGH